MDIIKQFFLWLPLNIASSAFVQSAADNADYLQDSIDGNKSVHMMSMAIH